ncbi:MAG TPA: 4-alpha-glucanotransferase [Polyangia bacterium]|nr:4-alpha-glucanotransferase [Polyangia bacterium]
MVPLFSIRSGTGWGLGEIPDLPRFARWAGRAGFSVLQLLPVNHAQGFDPSPYAALSAFALDPVYLSLDACEDFQAAGGRRELDPATRAQLDAVGDAPLVDWAAARALKQAGIERSFRRFLRDEWTKHTSRARQLAMFMSDQRAWLDDYALFVAWHDEHQKSWLDWPAGERDRDPGTIAAARERHQHEILRAKWTQWQLDMQWRKARREASAAGVELMGDLPFMVGIDSADVWSRRALFRTDLHVGTPPEEGSPDGQDWGLPIYDWRAHRHDDFAWIKARAQRAGELFGLYRVDHAIGFYRTYFRSVDGKSHGFTPTDEGTQVELGERIMRMMSHWGEVVAEDLGTQPPFLRPSLERLGIAGYRVLRWEKEGEEFRDPATWPALSVAANATHDTDSTAEWYDALGKEQREALRKLPRLGDLDPDKPFDDGVRDRLLATVYGAPSALALILYQDAIGTRERINRPGTVDAANWSYRIDRSVEELENETAHAERLARLATETGRAPRDRAAEGGTAGRDRPHKG